MRKSVSKIQTSRLLGGLAGNINWMLFTMPMSMANTFLKTGAINTFKGTMNWFTSPVRKREIRELTSMKMKSQIGVGQAGAGDLDKMAGNLYKTRIENYNAAISKHSSDWLEYHLTGSSMSAGLEQAKRWGLDKKSARIYADYIGQVTQSMYDTAHRTQLMNSLALRTAFPFQTFSFEMFRHIKNISGKGGGIPLNKTQRVHHAINLVVGTMVINGIHQNLFGKNRQTPGTFIPLAGSMADASIAEVAGLVSGEPREFATGRSPVAPMEDINRMKRAIRDIVNHGNYNRLRKELIFWSMGLKGIGGAGQVNRTIDGLIAAENEVVTDVTGKDMFEIKGSSEKIRAILFGPYNTGASKEYFEPTDDLTEIEKRIQDAWEQETGWESVDTGWGDIDTGWK